MDAAIAIPSLAIEQISLMQKIGCLSSGCAWCQQILDASGLQLHRLEAIGSFVS
jgi:hypothetical protein